MKKTFKNIRTLAALLIASAAFTACSNEDSAIIGEQPAQQQAPQVFTLTLQAGKTDGAGTRALALDGTKLVAKWADGDKVAVTNNGGTKLGELTASNVSADGKTCTFSGALSPAPSPNDYLTLTYHPMENLSDYNSQDGTLASAANYDVATATVIVESVSDGKITIKDEKATFSTQTAVLKLTLKDVADKALKATSLKISVEGTDIFTFTPTDATYTANNDGILYFALPQQGDVETSMGMEAKALASVPITFTATVGSDTYTATKTGYKLAGGTYYATELKMAKPADLSSISGTEYTVQNGQVLTGTLGSNMKISIADGAIVTLKNVQINESGTWTSGDYAGITCEGDATIILEGTNTVKGFADGYPGIFVSSGNTLVINGTGELNASSNGSYDNGSGGAGIGGGKQMNCGNIEIQSGTVTATGNQWGAGIGGGYNANCGDITISGGTVTATGGQRAAGIGGGRRWNAGGSCGNITISGGTITATGGEDAAGIGGGRGNGAVSKTSCGTITITSGVTSVTATKGSSDAQSIGAGYLGECGDVTIEDGDKVTQY